MVCNVEGSFRTLYASTGTNLSLSVVSLVRPVLNLITAPEQGYKVAAVSQSHIFMLLDLPE